MSAYDKWVGYMQRAVGEHTASTPSESPASAESSGLSGLLKTVSQKMPQPSAAANYLAGISGIASGAQTAHPEPAAGSSYASVLTSWITSFSAGSSAGTSDQQRLEDIKSRKLQLQSLVSQLETSERTILERNLPQKAPDTSEPTATAHTEASEFEDDAVMVGEPCAGSSTESRASSGSADGAKKPDRKSQPAASTPSRRWFW
ncbi:hypothetical protein H4S02_003353 [Coemansia sp. RSA 2611]|nr:hypothetical protein H4S02_003353 [Coemansia sp. RSA 2611]